MMMNENSMNAARAAGIGAVSDRPDRGLPTPSRNPRGVGAGRSVGMTGDYRDRAGMPGPFKREMTGSSDGGGGLRRGSAHRLAGSERGGLAPVRRWTNGGRDSAARPMPDPWRGRVRSWNRLEASGVVPSLASSSSEEAFPSAGSEGEANPAGGAKRPGGGANTTNRMSQASSPCRHVDFRIRRKRTGQDRMARPRIGHQESGEAQVTLELSIDWIA